LGAVLLHRPIRQNDPRPDHQEAIDTHEECRLAVGTSSRQA